MIADRAYLLQILESIRRIEEDTSGGRDAFMASHTLQDAVLRTGVIRGSRTERLVQTPGCAEAPAAHGGPSRKAGRVMKTQIARSSGNVFEDLGLGLRSGGFFYLARV
jgi:hypothetical protein